MANPKIAKRLAKEMNDLTAAPVEGSSISMPDQNVATLWHVTFAGPDGSPFAGGNFVVEVDFSDNYPFKCPKVKFMTKIYHPGVSRDKGEICTRAIEDSWVPTLNAKFVLEAVRSILLDPTEAANNPIENEIAQQYLTSRSTFDTEAAKWV